ncbi:MAG: nucleotide exchange factor GrpE [Spirochaetaceae bacterium]|nr:nucleotide exchange factor GrpE [Spirochaetaceae bacterium]
MDEKDVQDEVSASTEYADAENPVGASEKKTINEEALQESGAENGGAAEAGSCAEDSQEEDSAIKIAELTAKCAELSEQYLRKVADFENFRKRMQKEKQEAIDFANQNLLLDIIPVLDDFERAFKAVDDSSKTATDFTAFRDGVKMIEQRLNQTLENKWGLKRFDSKDAPFDPVRHEAVMMEKSSDIKEAVVQEDFMKGYMLKERIIRTAKVKVLMPE